MVRWVEEIGITSHSTSSTPNLVIEFSNAERGLILPLFLYNPNNSPLGPLYWTFHIPILIHKHIWPLTTILNWHLQFGIRIVVLLTTSLLILVLCCIKLPIKDWINFKLVMGIGLTISSTRFTFLRTNWFPLKLENILHVPRIKKNLLFVKNFTTNNNVYVEFHANIRAVKDEKTNQILMQGTIEDDFYLFQPHIRSATYFGEKTTIFNWHKRLGRPQFWILKKLINENGLLFFYLPENTFCHACSVSKSHKLLIKILATSPLNNLN